MALLSLRLRTNVEGNFFVDETCIDCDACRQIAPRTFGRRKEQSAVVQQPESDGQLLEAQKALISCPTASIGTLHKLPMARALAAYPDPVAENVFRCGYTAENSFGAFSYLICSRGAPASSRPSGVEEDGNILVDSPRFAGPLVRRIAQMGGVQWMALTHQDDVAEHAKFHDRFGCRRILHRDDVSPSTASVELQPSDQVTVSITPDLLMIPTPGHTKGHSVFLYRNRFLFTGDHLAWDEPRKRLYAFRSACWYSWDEQIRSMARLLDYRFEWVLPGHGRPVHLEAAQMHEQLLACVGWMKSVRG